MNVKQLRIAPGTVVLNQDDARPMSGIVVEPPEGETDHRISLWVQWADGTVELEAAADVTLTGHISVFMPEGGIE